ncbi:MAG: PEP-CTERM sorting domain-containing protein [Gemmatimonas sp.]
MKRFLMGALLLCSVPAHAQYLQEEYTADYSLRSYLTKRTDHVWYYTLQFRNEQTFDPNRVYGITRVEISGLGFGIGQGDPYFTVRDNESQAGAVFTGEIPAPDADHRAVQYTDWTFTSANYVPEQGTVSFGTGSPWFFGGFGLLGCSLPVVHQVGPEFAAHSGSTCASAGFTGWKAINLFLDFYEPTPDFDGAGIVARIGGTDMNRVGLNATIVTPEPSTWVMIGAGLILIGAVRRRRNQA